MVMSSAETLLCVAGGSGSAVVLAGRRPDAEMLLLDGSLAQRPERTPGPGARPAPLPTTAQAAQIPAPSAPGTHRSAAHPRHPGPGEVSAGAAAAGCGCRPARGPRGERLAWTAGTLPASRGHGAAPRPGTSAARASMPHRRPAPARPGTTYLRDSG